MSSIAPTLQLFFTERMARQLQASPRTVVSYRDTCRLLLRFVADRTGKAPSALQWQDIDAEMISAFLDHLQADRHNSARSRNTRLAALRSLFGYAALRHPEHAELIRQVLAIPQKRFDKTTVPFLNPEEVSALLGAPDLGRWEGRRDRALMALAVQTGLRLSELIGLNCGDVELGASPHVHCTGKGRKERCVPLTATTVAILRVWLQERAGRSDEPLFPTRTGRRLSDDAVERRVATHKALASNHCPSLQSKKLTPHVLRHTSAMSLLHAGVDVAVIALWLGHADIRSTDAYLHADLTIKERALARTTPVTSKPGRYRPPDTLLAFLESLSLSRPRRRCHARKDRPHKAPPPTAPTCRDNPGVGINPISPTSDLWDNLATHKAPVVQAGWPATPGPPPALHPDRVVLDQPGRAVVRLPDQPDDPPRRAQERAGPRSRHPRLDRALEPESPAIHLEQNCRTDLGLTGKVYSKDFRRGIREELDLLSVDLLTAAVDEVVDATLARVAQRPLIPACPHEVAGTVEALGGEGLAVAVRRSKVPADGVGPARLARRSRLRRPRPRCRAGAPGLHQGARSGQWRSRTAGRRAHQAGRTGAPRSYRRPG